MVYTDTQREILSLYSGAREKGKVEEGEKKLRPKAIIVAGNNSNYVAPESSIT